MDVDSSSEPTDIDDLLSNALALKVGACLTLNDDAEEEDERCTEKISADSEPTRAVTAMKRKMSEEAWRANQMEVDVDEGGQQ